LGELREIFVLYDEVVQVVSKVVSASCSTMAIENAEEADLGPFDVQVLLTFWFEDV